MKLGAAMSAFLFSVPAQAGDFSGAYSVELNKTEVVRLSEPAAAVIVGNPKIADVSVHSSDTMFVLGRGYGQTNLIVLNADGDTIMNADIQVVSPNSAGAVRVFAGKERETYSCAPYCLPSPVLGDAVQFVVLNTPEAPEINTTTISGPSTRPQNIVGVAVESEPDFSEDDPRRPYFPD